ncbi:unnamed protein product [Brassica rapa]|uniref:Uncharacterized protein n=2 Tax=Brassica TaxID=3705 RepID=A0A8D9H5U0_BRACM|nr:unnamed protein product [Brassica napus]CAG7893579.1 unnamed protein product [Brassica rapa]
MKNQISGEKRSLFSVYETRSLSLETTRIFLLVFQKETSCPSGSQTTRRRRGRPRKNLESSEENKEESEEDEDYEEVEIIDREKQKRKVRRSTSVEEEQKWRHEDLQNEEDEKKPDTTVKAVAPLSHRRSRRKNTPVKSWYQ